MSQLEIDQTTAALNLLSNTVFGVSTFANLPDPVAYTGRLIYVDDENRYYRSMEGKWITHISSELFVFSSEAYDWGLNASGQLGDNTITNRSSPVSVIGFTDWCQLAAGRDHSLGIRTNGTLWSWGCNGYGRLGDNTVTNQSSPVSVVGGFTDWCQVSGGGYHSLGVRTNGTAWAWGNNGMGRLGDNTITARSSPVSVVGGFADWCQVSAGNWHSLGVRTNGTAWAWGNNANGRLGDNTTVSRSSPVSVVGGFTDWCQVSAGCAHSVGVRTNGTAWGWGLNTSGQLGDNTVTLRSSPVSVVGGFTDWCQVAAGNAHNLGVRTNGSLWSWGAGFCGILGDNTVTNQSSPVSVVGGFTDWCQVSANLWGSIGLRTNGTAWAWGCNGSGQLGDNTTVNKSSPVSVLGGFTNWCQVSAGGSHNLAIPVRIKGF
jgi:alpha-tubulin suppressor-like RCC1 family protein